MGWQGAYWNLTETAFKQGIMEESSEATCPIGTHRPLSDGSIWVYCQAGASNIAGGLLTTPTTLAATARALAPVAHAAGTRVVTVTLATTTADQYAGGYLWTALGGALGERYVIVSNTATASGVIQVTLADPTVTLWNTSTTYLQLTESPYKLQVYTAVTGSNATSYRSVAVTQRPVTAGYFYWGLERGWGVVKLVASTAGAEFDEKWLTSPTSTAGQGTLVAAAGSAAVGNQIIGSYPFNADATDGDVALCWINLM